MRKSTASTTTLKKQRKNMQKEQHDDNSIIKQINHRLLAKQSNTYKKYKYTK